MCLFCCAWCLCYIKLIASCSCKLPPPAARLFNRYQAHRFASSISNKRRRRLTAVNVFCFPIRNREYVRASRRFSRLPSTPIADNNIKHIFIELTSNFIAKWIFDANVFQGCRENGKREWTVISEIRFGELSAVTLSWNVNLNLNFCDGFWHF